MDGACKGERDGWCRLDETGAGPVAAATAPGDASAVGVCRGGGGREGAATGMKGLLRIDLGPDGSLPIEVEDCGEPE